MSFSGRSSRELLDVIASQVAKEIQQKLYIEKSGPRYALMVELPGRRVSSIGVVSPWLSKRQLEDWIRAFYRGVQAGRGMLFYTN